MSMYTTAKPSYTALCRILVKNAPRSVLAIWFPNISTEACLAIECCVNDWVAERDAGQLNKKQHRTIKTNCSLESHLQYYWDSKFRREQVWAAGGSRLSFYAPRLHFRSLTAIIVPSKRILPYLLFRGLSSYLSSWQRIRAFPPKILTRLQSSIMLL